MSIIALSKVTLYGPAAEKDAVLDGLQSLGCLHLNNLQPGAAEGLNPGPRTPTRARHCSTCRTALCADERPGMKRS
jgi:V/A-type H+/Na+-transporting ATPase subunit I